MWVSWILVLISRLIVPSLVLTTPVEATTSIFNFITGILNPVVDVFTRTTCQYLQSITVSGDEELTSIINCDCSASFSIANGMMVNTFCALSDAICLDPNDKIFCGTTSVDAEYRGKNRKLKITACLEIDTGLAIELDGEQPQIPVLCITAQSTLLVQRDVFRIDSCAIRIGSEKCQSCTICDSGKDVKFDCSNIRLATLIGNNGIPGPVLDTCVGVGFIFNHSLLNGLDDVPVDGTNGTTGSNVTAAMIP